MVSGAHAVRCLGLQIWRLIDPLRATIRVQRRAYLRQRLNFPVFLQEHAGATRAPAAGSGFAGLAHDGGQAAGQLGQAVQPRLGCAPDAVDDQLAVGAQFVVPARRVA